MLDGIGENIGFELRSSLLTLGRVHASMALLSLYRSLAPFRLAYILLGTEDDSLASMQSVNPIYHLVKPLHLLELFGIDVKEVLLDWRVGTDAHDDDSGLLVLIALAVDLAQGLVCDLRDSNG